MNFPLLAEHDAHLLDHRRVVLLQGLHERPARSLRQPRSLWRDMISASFTPAGPQLHAGAQFTPLQSRPEFSKQLRHVAKSPLVMSLRVHRSCNSK